MPNFDSSLLPGGGEMGREVRALDWASTSLGPIAEWPHALRSTVTLMLNSAESMFLVWGPDLVFLFNDAYRPILGPRFDGALGQPIRTLWPEAWETIRPAIELALAGQSSRYIDSPVPLVRDGVLTETWWTYCFTPMHDDSGIPAGAFCITNETTTRVIAGASLKASQDHLRALNADLERKVIARTAERNRLWQLSPDLHGVLNAEGYFEETNPAWQAILGWSAAELQRIHFLDLLHADDRLPALAALDDMQRGAALLRVENRYRTTTGSYRWLAWQVVPEGGKIYCTARDVTDDKHQATALIAAEEALRQSQKLEAMGQLTGGVAHDFNNMLTVIKSATDLLKRDNLPPERQTRYVEAISDTVARAAKLTGQLLSFARRQALRPTVFDVAEGVRMLEEMLATLTGARAQLDLDLPDYPCITRADPNQFDNALINMVANARDAMEGAGVVTIRVRAVDAVPPVRLHPGNPIPAVAVSVTDTGQGIGADLLDRVFEPFFTTKPIGYGTGLGLSQVFGFAKQSGGEMSVESTPGEGSTFTLYLPRTDEAPEPTSLAEAKPPAPDGVGGSVLVIEDNVELGDFVSQMLADLGYRTRWVGDAEAALAELAANPGAHDIVFSDVMMPGMNGVELGREIQRLYPDLPFIMASGYSDVLAQDGGHPFELVQKPYSVEALAHALQKAGYFRRRR